MNYTTLIAAKGTPNSLADLVNYAPIAAVASDLIKNAQDEIFARLRVREMRKSLTLNLALGDTSAPLPADLLDTAFLFDPWNNLVHRVSEDKLQRARFYGSTNLVQSGQPSRLAIFDEAFQFDYAAYQPMTLRGMYFGANYLSPTVDTNFLTNRYSQLLRAVLMKHGLAYYRDEQAAALYGQAAETYFAQIEQSADLDYRGFIDDDSGEE